MSSPKRVFALNGGSSSLKFGLFSASATEAATVFSGEAQTIGAPTSCFRILDANGTVVHDTSQPLPTLAAAATLVFQQLGPELHDLHAIGHRIVHGGPHILEHQILTHAARTQLELAKDLAPLHTPAALAILDAVTTLFPSLPQVLCLDTAFHRTLPDRTRRLPLPAEAIEGGIQRYGAHGLSLESAVHLLGPELRDRCAIAHLGNGCSVTAVLRGRSADTTMGLTPAGGMMMGTRTGDLDPGVLIYLQRSRGWNTDKLEQVIERESGLLGVSGRSNDMRTLLAARSEKDPAATLALEMFAYEAALSVARMVIALDGLEQIVFTGGIGEHSVETRTDICTLLRPLEVQLDPSSNAASNAILSPVHSSIEIRIVPAQEEAQIARITAALT